MHISNDPALPFRGIRLDARHTNGEAGWHTPHGFMKEASVACAKTPNDIMDRCLEELGLRAGNDAVSMLTRDTWPVRPAKVWIKEPLLDSPTGFVVDAFSLRLRESRSRTAGLLLHRILARFACAL
ncbi:MAG: hypothetical protein ACRD2X_07285 [Vicinamibacteraceae bacterium]